MNGKSGASRETSLGERVGEWANGGEGALTFVQVPDPVELEGANDITGSV